MNPAELLRIKVVLKAMSTAPDRWCTTLESCIRDTASRHLGNTAQSHSSLIIASSIGEEFSKASPLYVGTFHRQPMIWKAVSPSSSRVRHMLQNVSLGTNARKRKCFPSPGMTKMANGTAGPCGVRFSGVMLCVNVLREELMIY